MREPAEADVECIRGWLTSPSDDTGVQLAADDGSWEFLPYATLAEHVRRVARLLVEQGVGSGHTVGVLMPTSHLCLAAMFAVLAAGATLTPIAPPMFGSHEQYRRQLRGVLESSQARAVVTPSRLVDAVVRASASATSNSSIRRFAIPRSSRKNSTACDRVSIAMTVIGSVVATVGDVTVSVACDVVGSVVVTRKSAVSAAFSKAVRGTVTLTMPSFPLCRGQR